MKQERQMEIDRDVSTAVVSPACLPTFGQKSRNSALMPLVCDLTETVCSAFLTVALRKALHDIILDTISMYACIRLFNSHW